MYCITCPNSWKLSHYNVFGYSTHWIYFRVRCGIQQHVNRFFEGAPEEAINYFVINLPFTSLKGKKWRETGNAFTDLMRAPVSCLLIP